MGDVLNKAKAKAKSKHPGIESLKGRGLVEVMWGRRTHRVSRGCSVAAGSMTYECSDTHAPLSELEEALLIAVTGCTGLTMPDRPFTDPKNGERIMAKPNLHMQGRTAGSPDNAQGTFFFLINDSGTFFLRRLDPCDSGADPFDPDVLIARARQAKVKVLDQRLDVGPDMRDFPAYLDSNRFLSNQPGTTVLFPVVDLSRQYINGLMYLLTQPEHARPAIVDDRNFYQPAGTKAWIKKGFLNNDIKVPLGVLGPLRTQVEADLLLQNIFLMAEAMGLGAWIHGALTPSIAMGDPKFSNTYGPMLGFDFVTPKWKLTDLIRWQVPLPKYADLRAHPIGLRHKGEHLIKGMCPPYYDSMKDAVAEVMASKFGPAGIYNDQALFAEIYKGDFGKRYLAEAEVYSQDVIACVTDICDYILTTHGRFPAHCDAIYAPGVWLQVHHVEQGYYERFFQNGLDEAHRTHDARWH